MPEIRMVGVDSGGWCNEERLKAETEILYPTAKLVKRASL